MSNVEQNGKLSIVQELEKTSPSGIPAVRSVAERFENLYVTIHNNANAKAFYEAEKFHFAKLVNDSKDLSACTKLSLYGCFLDVAISGLSFDPSFKHVYLVSYNTNVGTKQDPKWEKRAQLQISGQGELLLRMRQGQVKYVDNPVLVYEGDDFSFGTVGGNIVVNHMANLSKRTDKIIAGYLKITRNDGSTDYKVMTREEIEGLRRFSKDPNSKAWTDGFAGMFTAKLIKHAFKNYPKLRVGQNTVQETEHIDAPLLDETQLATQGQPTMNVPENIDYGTPDISQPVKTPAAATVQVDSEDF